MVHWMMTTFGKRRPAAEEYLQELGAFACSIGTLNKGV
jgi:hypothetical protein